MRCRTSRWSRAHVPAKTLEEFIAFAKARPNGISIGSPGPGTSPHLSGVLFAARTGVNAVHVPFRGAAQTIPAMLSGDVTFAVDNLASYISQIESGAMRALAITSGKRWPTLPNVPTMAEAGVKDFVVTSWGAYVMPAGTPQAIVDKIAAAHKEIAADQAMQKRFLAAGGQILHQHAGRNQSLRREGNQDVAGDGPDLRTDAAIGSSKPRSR